MGPPHVHIQFVILSNKWGQQNKIVNHTCFRSLLFCPFIIVLVCHACKGFTRFAVMAEDKLAPLRPLSAPPCLYLWLKRAEANSADPRINIKINWRPKMVLHARFYQLSVPSFPRLKGSSSSELCSFFKDGKIS